MKHSILLSILTLGLLYGQAQRYEIEFASIQSAVENKEPIDTLFMDFTGETAKLVIVMGKKMDAATLAKAKKGLEWLNVKMPRSTFALDVEENDGVKWLVINFPKAKLHTVPEGGELVLRTVAAPKFEILRIVNKKESDGDEGAEKGDSPGQPALGEAISNWKHLEKVTIDLQEFKIPFDFCCDTCRTCEDTMLIYNNRIIYDAVSGLTQFIPYDFKTVFTGDTTGNTYCNTCPPGLQIRSGRQRYIVRNGNRIKLKAGDPVVYIVKNVNPYLYDVELSDTAFLVNNASTSLLDNLLFAKQGIDPQSDKGKKEKLIDSQYLRVRAGLVHLRAEMGQLLENYRVLSRYAHNCIEQKKHEALAAIDNLLNSLGKYQAQSFSSFVDIYLNPSTADSSLNKSLKASYGEFWRSKYVVAYRFPEVPAFDQVNFNLSIKRKKDAPYPDLLSSKYPTQTAYVKNFLKIDVSSGIYFGSLRNREFTTRADSNLSVTPAVRGTRIVREASGNNEFGFASYLHFYYKTGIGFNAGLHMGAGINFRDDPQPRYFTGASFMFGNNNRLCLNTGIIWGNVKNLSDQYPKEPDGSYRWLPEGETSLVYKNEFKSGWFVSISYNLPFLKRNKGTAEIKPPAPKEDSKPVEKEGKEESPGGTGDDEKDKKESSQNIKMKKTVVRYE